MVVVVAFLFQLQTMVVPVGQYPAQQPAAAWAVRVTAGLALLAWDAKAAVAARQPAVDQVVLGVLVELWALVAVVVVALGERVAAARVVLVLKATQEFTVGKNHGKLRCC